MDKTLNPLACDVPGCGYIARSIRQLYTHHARAHPSGIVRSDKLAELRRIMKGNEMTSKQQPIAAGVWDEKTKTWLKPSGTVKQGRRPMFRPTPLNKADVRRLELVEQLEKVEQQRDELLAAAKQAAVEARSRDWGNMSAISEATLHKLIAAIARAEGTSAGKE